MMFLIQSLPTRMSAIPELCLLISTYQCLQLRGKCLRLQRGLQQPLVALHIDLLEASDSCGIVGHQRKSLTLTLPAHQISTKDPQSDEVRPIRLDELPCSLFLNNNRGADTDGGGLFQVINGDILIPNSVYQGLDPSYKSLRCKVVRQTYQGHINLQRTEVTVTGWEHSVFPAHGTASSTHSPASRTLNASPGSRGFPAANSQPRSTSRPHRITEPSFKSSDAGFHGKNPPTLIEAVHKASRGFFRHSLNIRPMIGGTLRSGRSVIHLPSTSGSLRPAAARSEETATDLGVPLGPPQTISPDLVRLRTTDGERPNLRGSPQTTYIRENDLNRIQTTFTREIDTNRIQTTVTEFTGLQDGARATVDSVHSQVTAMSETSPSKTPKNNPSISGSVQQPEKMPSELGDSDLGTPLLQHGPRPQQSGASENSNEPTSFVPGKLGNPPTHQFPPTVGQRATRLPLATLPTTSGGQSQESVPISFSEQLHSETRSKNRQRASELSVPISNGNPEELPNTALAALPAVNIGGRTESFVPVNLPSTVDRGTPRVEQSATIPIAQGSKNTNTIPNQGSGISTFPEFTVGGQREQLVPIGSSEAIIGSQTVVSSSAPVLEAGTSVSLGQLALAASPSFVPLGVSLSDSAPQSQARIGGTAIALNPTAVPIAGTILSLGGPAVTVDNAPVSLGRMGLVVGSSTLPVPNKGPRPTFAFSSDKGLRVQSTAAGNLVNLDLLQFARAGTTLSQGGPGITVSNTPISLGPSGLIVDGATLSRAAASQASLLSPLLVAGQVFTPNPAAFPIANTALSRGGPGVTLSGTLVSLGPSGLVVGNTNFPLAAELRATQSPLTVAGQIFTPNPSAFAVAGTTLSLGGPGITISQTPLSLGASGLLIGSSTLSLGTSISANLVDTPSVFSIAGNVVTRGGSPIIISGTRISLGLSGLVIGTRTVPLSAPAIPAATTTTPLGAIYSIGGTRITQGGPAITLSGTRVSLGHGQRNVCQNVVELS
ncbi:MAG: hypothetical protein Q9167_007314 [Letrouitia subvulpina]